MSAQWRRAATPFALALISLVAAVALWVAVTDAENPRTTYDFGAGLTVRAVNVPQGQAVRSITETVVFIRVSTTEEVFEQLTTADFAAEINMSAERQEVSSKAVTVRVVDRDDVEVVSVTPGVVEVVLEEETSRQVPVQVNRQGTPPQGIAVSAVEPNPTTVRVSGAASLVERVASAVVDINLTGVRVSQQQQYSLSARDPGGVDLRPLRIEPSAAEVRIAVSQVEVSWAATVVVQTRGSVATGYNLVSMTTDPLGVTIQGPVEQAQAITFLPTEEIDLTNLRANQTRTVRLQVPSNVRATRDTVSVTLGIEPAQGEFALPVAPTIVGLGPNLRATLQTPTITVRVRGPAPTLTALAPGSIRATVNAEGLGEGVHVLEASISVPQGVTLVGVEPSQVVVVINSE